MGGSWEAKICPNPETCGKSEAKMEFRLVGVDGHAVDDCVAQPLLHHLDRAVLWEVQLVRARRRLCGATDSRLALRSTERTISPPLRAGDADRGAALVIAAVPLDGKPDGEPSSAARKLENQANIQFRTQI